LVKLVGERTVADKKSKEDKEYEDLMREVEQAQNDKFLLDEDFDEMGYAYGGKIMKRKVGGPMRGYGVARPKLQRP